MRLGRGPNRGQREALLEAVRELCGERGFAEISVAMVIERAGVAPGAFAEHFAEVEDCLLAALDAGVEIVVGSIASAYEADRSEVDSALHGIHQILVRMAEEPGLAAASYITIRHGPPRLAERYGAVIRIMVVMLERLWEYGPLGEAVAGAARAGLGGAEALIRRELIAGNAERLPELLPQLVYVALAPMLGREEALRLGRRGELILAEEAAAGRGVIGVRAGTRT